MLILNPQLGPAALSKRQLLLMRKEQDGSISAAEQGEMNGRFAHPGNERAIKLVQKELTNSMKILFKLKQLSKGGIVLPQAVKVKVGFKENTF